MFLNFYRPYLSYYLINNLFFKFNKNMYVYQLFFQESLKFSYLGQSAYIYIYRRERDRERESVCVCEKKGADEEPE